MIALGDGVAVAGNPAQKKHLTSAAGMSECWYAHVERARCAKRFDPPNKGRRGCPAHEHTGPGH